MKGKAEYSLSICMRELWVVKIFFIRLISHRHPGNPFLLTRLKKNYGIALASRCNSMIRTVLFAMLFTLFFLFGQMNVTGVLFKTMQIVKADFQFQRPLRGRNLTMCV